MNTQKQTRSFVPTQGYNRCPLSRFFYLYILKTIWYILFLVHSGRSQLIYRPPMFLHAAHCLLRRLPHFSIIIPHIYFRFCNFVSSWHHSVPKPFLSPLLLLSHPETSTPLVRSSPKLLSHPCARIRKNSQIVAETSPWAVGISFPLGPGIIPSPGCSEGYPRVPSMILKRPPTLWRPHKSTIHLRAAFSAIWLYDWCHQ